MNTGTIVELAPGMGGFYKGAEPGCRGIVADAKKDNDGFDIILVKWDRVFSVYSAPQEDGWCYPGHFLDVGSETPEQYATRMIADSDAEPPQGGHTCADCGTHHSEDEMRDNYLASLHASAEEARTAEGFALLWVARRDVPDEEGEYLIQPRMTWESLTPEGQVLLKAHLLHVATVMANDLMLAEVNQVVQKKDR